jgi:hypothetical protein
MKRNFLFLKGSCQFKTNTVLQYKENKNDVKSWGYPALAKRPDRRNFDKNKQDCVVELFKLQLGNLNKDLKKKYEPSVNYKKAITDYLREIGKVSVRDFNSYLIVAFGDIPIFFI